MLGDDDDAGDDDDGDDGDDDDDDENADNGDGTGDEMTMKVTMKMPTTETTNMKSF